jgi:hypothetical protein
MVYFDKERGNHTIDEVIFLPAFVEWYNQALQSSQLHSGYSLEDLYKVALYCTSRKEVPIEVLKLDLDKFIQSLPTLKAVELPSDEELFNWAKSDIEAILELSDCKRIMEWIKSKKQ